MKQYLAEAIGAFFLVLTIGLCGNQGVVAAPLAIGAALAVMVYAGGHISGAHYNPAVTLAAWLRGALPARQVIPYWAAQFAGAIVAAFLVLKFTGRALHVAPADTAGWGAVLLGEVLFTFGLAYVVLNVATARETQGNAYFGAAIGGTVMVGAFAMGGISGGAFNPAVGLGPAIVEAMLGQRPPSSLAWIYAVGPFAGAAIAAFVFKFQHPGE
ncbi:MAG TPA: MIP/aquaporin family protein [Gemmatimonadaceae bacterium]|nr:MIP/aquaporin family protein [Gemmatimonadaceae bacterium]